MIIESAFLNTMSTLLESSIWEKPNEEQLRGIFLQKIYEQFELLYLDKTRIFPQCRYPLAKTKSVDIKVCLPNVQITGDILSQYGVKANNWIEIKFLKKKFRAREIIEDILRLCLFTKELIGKIKENARYFLLVTDFQIRKASNNTQIKKLFIPGLSKDVEIDLDEIFNGYKLKLDIYTREVVPLWTSEYPKNIYCAYLIKIVKFSLIGKNKGIIFSYSDERGNHFSEDSLNTLKTFASKFEKVNQKVKQ